MSPLVSVILPVYNGEATLKRCLEAIFASDYPNYEVIVVDDCSSDGSMAIAGQFPCTVVTNDRQSGAAHARNNGARQSMGEILFFTDSDVIIQRDTIGKLVNHLKRQSEYSAIFGSYTAETVPTNFFSVYKNLVHHFTHQTGREDASTFWAGCGAMWATTFFNLGGFDPADTSSADVEDIALGYRLVREGYRVRLAKEAQVTHAKYYSFIGLLKSDIFHRALPWTKLMMTQRLIRNDLNTRWENFFSTLLSYGIVALLVLGFLAPTGFLLLPVLFALFAYLNRELFGLFLTRCGVPFLLKAIAMTILFYIYCLIGFGLGVLSLAIEGRPATKTIPALSRAAPATKRES